MMDCGAGDRYTNMTYPPSSDHSTFKKRVELATRSERIGLKFLHIYPARRRTSSRRLVSRTAAASLAELPAAVPGGRPAAGQAGAPSCRQQQRAAT